MRLQKKGGGCHGIGIDLTLASGLSRPFECLLASDDELLLLADTVSASYSIADV